MKQAEEEATIENHAEEIDLDELHCLLECGEISPEVSNAGHFLLWTYFVQIPVGFQFQILTPCPNEKRYEQWHDVLPPKIMILN